MTMHGTDDIKIRAAHDDDRAAVLELLARSLGWVPNETFEAFFSWKHELNPFGPSGAWVATTDDEIVGFRTFVRWEYDHPDGRLRRAVRAVDTATHPDYQGRGIFKSLTLHAIEDLARERVDFVFNTPNEQSRPGYLRMGWSEVGRVPAALRPLRPSALVRMLRSRVAAERWSEPVSAGEPAAAVLDAKDLDTLVGDIAPPSGLRTRRTASYLRWRYGFEPLHYRAVTLHGGPARGIAVFRVRKRGAAREAALCDVVVPGSDSAAASALVRQVARCCDADYVIRVGRRPLDRNGFVRLPGQGPILTWRPVTSSGPPPELAQWELQLGDVELL